jgi:hypothetical protein
LVKASLARNDVDRLCLTKTVTYYSYSVTKDLSYGSEVRGSPTSYSIKAQITTQIGDTDWNQEGKIGAGDAVGFLRYEYTQDASGTAITPTLVPKEFDEILFNSIKYRIDKITAATSEELLVIGWDIILKEIR